MATGEKQQPQLLLPGVKMRENQDRKWPDKTVCKVVSAERVFADDC